MAGVSTSGNLLQSRRTHVDPQLYGSAAFGAVWMGSCFILAALSCAPADRTRSRQRARRQLANRLPRLRTRRTRPRAREQLIRISPSAVIAYLEHRPP